MKKLLAIVLTVAMVLSVLAIEVAFATTEPTITIETVEAKAGESVVVNVNISNNPGVWGLKIKVAYDRSVLTLASVENGDFFANGEWTKGDINKETYTLSYSANDFADITTASATLATLTFSVSDTAQVGEYNITASYTEGDIINCGSDDVDFNIVNGKVTVLSESTPTQTPDSLEQYFTYKISDGEVTITGFDDSFEGEAVIPSTIEGYPVTSIGYEAFYCCQISGITLPDTIVSIEKSAFYACENLNKIDLGENLKTIGYAAFERCYALKEVNFPESLEIISEYAFIECSLECIAIPDNVTTIGSFAFQSNESLKTIILGTKVENIGINAFLRKANNLESISVDENNQRYYSDGKILVDTTEQTVLAVCNVEEIVVPDGVKILAEATFSGNNKLCSIVIPETVTSIAKFSFKSCSALENIYYCGTEEQWQEISINSLGNDTLLNANIVYEYVKETPDPLKKYQYFTYEISNDEVTITDCDETASGDIEIPATIEGYPVTSIGSSAFENCDSLTGITIPDSVTSIGSSAFEGCDKLADVTIGKGLTSIEAWVFARCTSLTSIIIPGNVISIDYESFSGCTNLKRVVLCEGVKTIGTNVFSWCTNLTDIVFPESLCGFGDSAITGSAYYDDPNNWENDVMYIGSNLYSAKNTISGMYTIKENTKTISFMAFSYCDNLTSIIIPESITVIDDSAFDGCSGLETVYYTGTEEQWNNIVIYEFNDYLINANIVYEYGKETPDPLKKYQYFTYEISNDEVTITDCDETASGYIEVPETIEDYPVTKIGDGAFAFCSNIQSVKLPECINYIGNYTFSSCTNLTSISIPQNVSYIGWYCFDQCYKLESIELPTNISRIENQAFGFCKSLKSIVIPEGVKGICADAFLGCEILETVQLPNTLETIAYYAFINCNELKYIEYNGTEQEWNNIEIDMEGNEVLENVTITYAVVTPTPTATPTPVVTPTPTATPTPVVTPTPTATPTPVVTPTPTAPAKNGWVDEGGVWYYYIEDEKVTNDWMLDSVGWCYLTEDGSMATNKWILDSVGWCYVGSDGYCVTDTWMQDSIGWCYLDSEGRMVTNKWIQDSAGWCYIGADGYCLTDCWMADSIGWCYLDSNGRMVTNSWIKDSVGWCYVGSEGYCLTNCWMADSIGWCYLDADGRMVTNGWIQDSTGWCWLDSNGYWDGIYR